MGARALRLALGASLRTPARQPVAAPLTPEPGGHYFAGAVLFFLAAWPRQ